MSVHREYKKESGENSGYGPPDGKWRPCVRGIPTIDPGALQASWENFEQSALPAISQWAKDVPGNVQYVDVMARLKQHSLPRAYEGVFCRKALLPKLEEMYNLNNLSPRLLAILYSIHLVDTGKELLSCDVDSKNSLLMFTVDHKVQGVRFKISYAVSDYTHPKTAKFSQMGTERV
jgi:hypothetical protein